MAEILSARVRIVCTCKMTFDVDLGDASFAKCPTCGDVCYVNLQAREHWTDPRERPLEEDEIVVGVAIDCPGIGQMAVEDDDNMLCCPTCGWVFGDGLVPRMFLARTPHHERQVAVGMAAEESKRPTRSLRRWCGLFRSA